MTEEDAAERWFRESEGYRRLYELLGERMSANIRELLEGVDVLLAEGEYGVWSSLPDSEQRRRIEKAHRVIVLIRESLEEE